MIVCVLSGILAWRNGQFQTQVTTRINQIQGTVVGRTILSFEIMPTSPPRMDGAIKFRFKVHNKSTVSAGPGNVWIHICNKCTFGSTPGFANFSGPSGKDRMNHFDYLDAGVHTDIISAEIFVPKPPEAFDIALYYSCEHCNGNMTDPMNWSHVSYPPFQGDFLGDSFGVFLR